MADRITEQVVDAIVSVRHLRRDTISETSSLAELGFDSLDTLNLLFALEETFHISIPDEQARRVRTVGDVVEGVRKLAASATVAGGTGEHAA